ncbi:DNA ligase 1-like [Gigantopelta aegis]|uniref:DNA ligase 1-like n=1 Tax=Gigantopelta aegis TaxID=1735272 RepID=UPI001B88800B|nr:DNA ligase 1-like [Gigantopelta aegis]
MEHPKGIHSDSLLVCLRGILSKSWQTRWCVLHPGNEETPPKLVIFESEPHSIKHPHNKKVIDLGQVEHIRTERLHSKPKGLEHGFEILTSHQKHTFAVNSERSLNTWIKVLHQQVEDYQNRMASRLTHAHTTAESDDEEDYKHLYMDDNIIYESADPNAVPMYRVQIADDETAQRFNLHGWYFLAINPVNLALIDCGSRKALYQWPYRFIRRFGRTESVFQFESGRRCLSGIGSFIFYTTEGDNIYENVNFRTKQIRHQEEVQKPSNIVRQTSQEKISTKTKKDQITQSNESQERAASVGSKEKPVPKPRNHENEFAPRSNSVGQSYKAEHSTKKELFQSVSAERNNNHNTIGPSHLNDSFKKKLELRLKPQDGEDPESGSTLSKSLNSDTTVENQEEKVAHAALQKTVSGRQLSDKKKKQEEKKRKEEEEKERKKRLKEEEKRKKEELKRLKEEKKKSKRSDKKRNKTPTTSLTIDPYDEPTMLNDYEDISDMSPRDSGEPMYSEAAQSPPKPVFTSSKPSPNQKAESNPGDIYSQPVKTQGDAWKEHCREGDNEHSEDYDKIKMAASMQPSFEGPPIPEKNFSVDEEDDDDETYDRFTNEKTATTSENIYGMASATSVFKAKSTAASKVAPPPLYEEPDALVAAVAKVEEPLYEEAEVQVMPVFGRDSYTCAPGEYVAYEKKNPSLAPQGGEDDEDPYSDVT